MGRTGGPSVVSLLLAPLASVRASAGKWSKGRGGVVQRGRGPENCSYDFGQRRPVTISKWPCGSEHRQGTGRRFGPVFWGGDLSGSPSTQMGGVQIHDGNWRAASTPVGSWRGSRRGEGGAPWEVLQKGGKYRPSAEQNLSGL